MVFEKKKKKKEGAVLTWKRDKNHCLDINTNANYF